MSILSLVDPISVMIRDFPISEIAKGGTVCVKGALNSYIIFFFLFWEFIILICCSYGGQPKLKKHSQIHLLNVIMINTCSMLKL